MARLNLWQRLGIVLSVLWVFGAGYWSRANDLGGARFLKELSYRKCIERFPAGSTPDRKGCALEADQVSDLFLAQSWENVAIFVFGILIAGWAVGFVATKTVRWVMAGNGTVN